MALVPCPNCGANISSTAKKCIHCNCTINVCPECNTVSVGEEKECKNCGFNFQNETVLKRESFSPKSTVTPPSQKGCAEIYQDWKNESAFNKHVLGGQTVGQITNFLGTLLMMAAAVIVLVWIFKGITGDANAAFEGLLKYQDTFKTATALVIVSLVFSALSRSIYYYAYHSAPISLSRYAKAKQIDLTAALDYTLSTDFSHKPKEVFKKDRVSAHLVSKALLFENSTDIQEKSKIRCILRSILEAIPNIFIGIFVIKNIEILMQHYIITTEMFKFSQLVAWWALAAWIVAMIIPSAISTKWEGTQTCEWIQINFSQHQDVYIKHIKPRATRWLHYSDKQ